MEIEEILRAEPQPYNGYTLKVVVLSLLSPKDITAMKYERLKRVPRKISAYLYRHKINRVLRSTRMLRPYDEYYLVYATDGTLFHLEY